MLSRFFRGLTILLLVGLPIFFLVGKIQADDLAETLIRLNRNSLSTQTTMQICATTPGSDNGTEDNVKITFPSDFTVSTTTSDWTVSTSNIFNDATAWPGIGTATNVSGQTVTFPSSDLNTSTKYCFKTTNSSALTTPSSADNHPGTLGTYQGGSLIDSGDFALAVGDNDQISVSAEVPASPSDFEADMALTSPTGDTFPQDTTLTYTLTYGSNLNTPSNITVEAEWSLGTISGEGSPSVEVLDYVVGSASDAYNSTSPVIDTVNRTISWDINSFPANTTGQTVTFQLKTNSNYQESEKVSFDVSGRVVGPGTQTSDSTVTKNYQFSPTTTPTPTSAPTSTTGAGATNTPTPITSTPTPSPEELTITDVEVRTLSPNSAQIFTSFSKNADVTLNYGTNRDNLTEQISRSGLSNYLLAISELSPNTRYYFTITATDNTQTITPELFTFTTAERQPEITILDDSFIVVSNDLIVYDQSLVERGKIIPLVILPTNSEFTFSLSFENHEQIETIQAFLRKKNVLASENSAQEVVNNITLVETQPGEYSAHLEAGVEPGRYELYLRINDTLGNIFEEKAGEFKIVPPFTVVEKNSGSPVEGARVKFSIYDPVSKTYSVISPDILPIENPAITNNNGELATVLPQGRYKAEVTSPNYENRTVEFVLGADEGQRYPRVELEKTSFNILSYGEYFLQTITDYYDMASGFIERASRSNRVFELVSFIVLTVFLLAAFRALLSRTHNSVRSFAHYIAHYIKTHKLNGEIPGKGAIKDKNGKAISKAFVSFIKDNEVIFQTSTNFNGIFFTNGKDFDHIEVSKVGFEDKTFPFNHQIDENIPAFHLEKHGGYIKNTIDNIVETFHFLIGMLFEILVIILIIMELLFIPAFGIAKVLPYLTLTLLMLIIFIHQNIAQNR